MRVLVLAARAYHRLTREILLSEMSATLSDKATIDESFASKAMKDCLPLVSKLTGAKQVSILLNLPFSRPITHSLQVSQGTHDIYDDGKILGGFTLRSFIYGDQIWYEPVEDYAKRTGTAVAAKYSGAKYFCISPLAANQTNIGVIMLTNFDDEKISQLIKSGGIEEERTTMRMLVDCLAGALSERVIWNLSSQSQQTAALMDRVRSEIHGAGSKQDFLTKYCEALSLIADVSVMIHQKVIDRGVAIAHAGLTDEAWQHLVELPFNLQTDGNVSFGPSVVAFRERKSSYVKDWTEIREKLHPRSVSIFENYIDARSLIAVPISNGTELYVVSMLSSKKDEPKDPGLIKLVESTEALFDAALTLIEQRQNLVALEAAAAIARMTQMLAHDVRMPFSTLRAGMNVLSNVDRLEDLKITLKNLVPEVERGLAQVDGLIADVMEVGSTESAMMTEPIPIGDLITSTLEDVIRIHPKSELAVQIEFTHRATAKVHPTKVGRVMANIIGNAIQAMGERGSMWIRTNDRNEFIEVCIGNRGSYIDAENRTKVFEAFYTRGKKSGTGLGLAIAKKIISAHGGEIWVESQRSDLEPTGIVEFHFTLPTCRETLESEEPRKLILNFKPSSPLHPQSLRDIFLPTDQSSKHDAILIIDDSIIFLDAWEKSLRADITVYAVNSAKEALEIMVSRPDIVANLLCVITDMNFDGEAVDGVALGTSLKQIRPDLPIILCTSEPNAKKVPGSIDFVIAKAILKFDDLETNILATIRKSPIS